MPLSTLHLAPRGTRRKTQGQNVSFLFSWGVFSSTTTRFLPKIANRRGSVTGPRIYSGLPSRARQQAVSSSGRAHRTGPPADVVAGHSLGDTPPSSPPARSICADAVRLVRNRGKYMQESRGGLVAARNDIKVARLANPSTRSHVSTVPRRPDRRPRHPPGTSPPRRSRRRGRGPGRSSAASSGSSRPSRSRSRRCARCAARAPTPVSCSNCSATSRRRSSSSPAR